MGTLRPPLAVTVCVGFDVGGRLVEGSNRGRPASLGDSDDAVLVGLASAVSSRRTAFSTSNTPWMVRGSRLVLK